MKQINSIVIQSVRFYQWLSHRVMPARCRFYPSCSEYAVLAFTQLSFFRACGLVFSRVLSCHPFHQGGIHTKGVNL